MELHPMEGVHNWKQFLVHMAIVVLGVCIAIGLEQTVEKIHHVHQQHEFEAQLREEGQANQKIVQSDVRWMDLQVGWLLDAKSAVDRYRLSHRKGDASFPPRPVDDTQVNGSVGDADPQMAVWTRGKESGLVSLLPAEEAEAYGSIYGLAELEIEQDHTSLKVQTEPLAMVAHDRAHPVLVDLTRMSDEELAAFSLALGRTYMAWHFQRRLLVMFYGENKAVLDGGGARPKFNEQIAAAFQRFPDRYSAF
jgi:hypothetical protein